MEKKLHIGIDPSMRKKGFAVCIIQNGKVDFILFDKPANFVFWLLLGDAPANSENLEVYVCIENSNLTNATFLSSTNKGIQNAISRKAGKNQAISDLVIDLCGKKYDVKNVLGISPKEKGAKWNDATFKAVIASEKHILGQNYKNNQDFRDAYQIALHGVRKFKK